jgi:hypothetical protein
VKTFIQRLFRFISTLLLSVKRFINQYADEAVQVVGYIKEAVESDEAEIIVSLTKTKKDDRILAILRKVLAALFPEQVDGRQNTHNTVKATVDHLKTLSPGMRSAAYLKIASNLTQEIAAADKKELSASDCDLLAQLSYAKVRNQISA